MRSIQFSELIRQFAGITKLFVKENYRTVHRPCVASLVFRQISIITYQNHNIPPASESLVEVSG